MKYETTIKEAANKNKSISTDEAVIRNETESDYRAVEELIRESFWNLYVPGCAEHYLAHVIRTHEDFIPELDLVLELNRRIIGNIMYTKARLVDEEQTVKTILTFGPVCISPEYQRTGYGKKLIEASFRIAAGLGYDAIVIFGDPGNYVGRGFKSCKKYNVCLEDGSFPAAMMVKELRQGALDGRKWIYYESPAFKIEEENVPLFDAQFDKKEKKYQTSQESFYIYSQSVVR